MPRGYLKKIEIMKTITRSYFIRIHSENILNEDFSNYYYCSGHAYRDRINNGSRGSTESLHNRNKGYSYVSDDTKNTVCKGIKVSFAFGRSAHGFICSIFFLISNLSIAQFSSKYFRLS